MKHVSGCLICGKELEYTEEKQENCCFYCGKQVLSNVKCPENHFVCDACHSSSANDLIEKYTITTLKNNPVEMADDLMKSPVLAMHGPEHHFLVPAVLLAAYYNHNKDFSIKKSKIKTARKRAEIVPGGYCGSHGNCGAGVGSGIFISIITGATPLAEKEWQMSNLMTSRSLCEIAMKGGPRCCKRDTYISIIEATAFLKEYFNVELPVNEKEVRCSYHQNNKQCLQKDCIFFKE